jgi:hypothetical protein
MKNTQTKREAPVAEHMKKGIWETQMNKDD